jgi:tRNA dimethylallyltransferase
VKPVDSQHPPAHAKPSLDASTRSTPARPLLVLVGPTAAGKTELALQLATEFRGEIISADSRLFYRGMNIGTAKPTAAEQARVTHHLVDICLPDETLTLAQYQRRAYRTIEAVQARGRLPILVGGTGQYVKAVSEGWRIPKVAPQPRLRQVLASLGQSELARWLRHLDPTAAARLDPHNQRRLIRALEVTLVSGHPISHLQRKKPPPYQIQAVGLYWERESLYQRIDERVDQMMTAGLLAEVKGLRNAGYSRHLPAMSSLGYRQIWDHLEGELTLVEAIERIKFETHRFSRQQATWFRRDDPSISWFDMDSGDVTQAVIHFVRSWLLGDEM